MKATSRRGFNLARSPQSSRKLAVARQARPRPRAWGIIAFTHDRSSPRSNGRTIQLTTTNRASSDGWSPTDRACSRGGTAALRRSLPSTPMARSPRVASSVDESPSGRHRRKVDCVPVRWSNGPSEPRGIYVVARTADNRSWRTLSHQDCAAFRLVTGRKPPSCTSRQAGGGKHNWPCHSSSGFSLNPTEAGASCQNCLSYRQKLAEEIAAGVRKPRFRRAVPLGDDPSREQPGKRFRCNLHGPNQGHAKSQKSRSKRSAKESSRR